MNNRTEQNRKFLYCSLWQHHIIWCYYPSVPWTQWTPWTLSMDLVDIYHGLSGQSMDTLIKVQWVHGQSPVRPARLDNVHGFSGHCPWTQWTLSMDSVDSLDIVHGQPGQSPGSPGRLDNVHSVHGLTRHCPWTHWTKSSQIWLKNLKLK